MLSTILIAILVFCVVLCLWVLMLASRLEDFERKLTVMEVKSLQLRNKIKDIGNI